jgi:hypothetical protein
MNGSDDDMNDESHGKYGNSENHEKSDTAGGGGESAPASRFVRLQVEVLLEISDADDLTGAALDRIAADEYLPEDERAHAQDAVRRDEAEALAYLVDPFELLSTVPGVDLLQASWSSSHTEYDPDAEGWDLYEDVRPDGHHGAEGPEGPADDGK